MTEMTDTSSKNNPKLTRLLRDGIIMVVVLAGLSLLHTEIRKQIDPLYQDAPSFAENSGDLAALYKRSNRGNIQNDPGALYTNMPHFQSIDELDHIEPAAGDE